MQHVAPVLTEEGELTKAKGHVHCCSGTLKNSKCPNDWWGHAVLGLVNFEVLQRPVVSKISGWKETSHEDPKANQRRGTGIIPLSLSAPVFVRRYLPET